MHNSYDPLNIGSYMYIPSEGEPISKLRNGCITNLISVVLAFVIMVVISVFSSCSTQKVTEHRHHFYSEADTLAIHAKEDSQMVSWQSKVDSSWLYHVNQVRDEWKNRSDEKEVTTEIVTTATDSLGNVIRTEQRRTERILSQQQQHAEERFTREPEIRLRMAVDSIDGVWRKRYNAIQAHLEQSDSTSISKKTIARQLTPWQNFRLYIANAVLIFIAATIVAWIIRKRAWWLRIFSR